MYTNYIIVLNLGIEASTLPRMPELGYVEGRGFMLLCHDFLI